MGHNGTKHFHFTRSNCFIHLLSLVRKSVTMSSWDIRGTIPLLASCTIISVILLPMGFHAAPQTHSVWIHSTACLVLSQFWKLDCIGPCYPNTAPKQVVRRDTVLRNTRLGTLEYWSNGGVVYFTHPFSAISVRSLGRRCGPSTTTPIGVPSNLVTLMTFVTASVQNSLWPYGSSAISTGLVVLSGSLFSWHIQKHSPGTMT